MPADAFPCECPGDFVHRPQAGSRALKFITERDLEDTRKSSPTGSLLKRFTRLPKQSSRISPAGSSPGLATVGPPRSRPRRI